MDLTLSSTLFQRLPDDLKTTIFQYDVTFHHYFKHYIEPFLHAYHVYRVQSNNNNNLFLILPRPQAGEDFNALLTNHLDHPSFITMSYEDNETYLSYFTILCHLPNIRRKSIHALLQHDF